MTLSRAIVGRSVRFVRDLREAGLPVGMDRGIGFLRALELIQSLDPERIHHAALATLVSDPEHVERFEEVFARHWFPVRTPRARPQKVPTAPRHDATHNRTALMAFMAEQAPRSAPEVEIDELKAATIQERLGYRDFSTLTDAERQAVLQAMQSLNWRLARRRSRRLVPHRRGEQVDLRRALRRAASRGGKVLELPKLRRKQKRRPLVFIADVSGSMELYTRILLTLFHTVGQAHAGAETFVFGTRLTRITGALRLQSVDAALDEVSRDVDDFAGGTRIGACLKAFNVRHARRVLRRGAVVIVVSDGWEGGNAAELGRQVGLLRSRCHRLIWLNPCVGREGYQPRVAGMAAALPHVDDFLPIRNLHSLQGLAAHLANLPPRKAGIARRGGMT